MRFYLTYKDRGLYDPVVDDTEVIYIPVDAEELENVNKQTNVHEAQQIIETIEFDQNVELPLFVQPVQVFLTDPQIGDLPLLINVDDIPPEGKFRLPVSDNYDPEGNRLALNKSKQKAVTFNFQNLLDKANEEKIRIKQAQDAVSEYISESKIKQKEDLFQKNQETDESFIRDEALEVVCESIDRAISVVKEINENIDTATKSLERTDLTELITEELSKSFEEESKSRNVQKESIKSIECDVNVSEEIRKLEKVDTQTSESKVEERKLLTKHDIEEAILLGTVSRTSEIFNKENIEITKPRGYEINEDLIHSERDESNYRDSDAKQRAFSIGLQTIPHIRENVNSFQIDSRFNLLTTFFLQLTNIMVTLSRFIGAEPNTYVAQGSYSQKQKQHGFERNVEKTKVDKSNEQAFESLKRHEEGQGLSKYKYEQVSHDSEEQLIRKGKLSGAKIAQIEGRKTAELTDKMDTVISEFQKKTASEEQSNDQFFQSRCGSRSKMKNEENIFKSDSQKQSHFNDRKAYEEVSETKIQSYDIREMKSEKHTFESKTTKTETKPYTYNTAASDDKNLTYVAIVEAHVYTNKNAIFEEKMRRERELISQNLENTKIETKQERKLSLADTTIIPQSEQINKIEKSITKTEKGVTGIEQSTLKIAAKKISEVLEPLVELTSDRSYSFKQAYTTQEPFKSVVQNTEISAEESQQYFVATAVMSQKINPSLEKPTKSVVEITEITADENESQDLNILKLTELKPKSIYAKTEDAKQIAETIEISIKEDELAVLEQSMPHLKQSRQFVESVGKSVAETTEVVTESKTDVLVAPEKLVTTSRTAIEDAFKTTAETLTILPEESDSNFVEGPTIKQESAKILIEEKVSSEVFEVSLIEQREESLDEKKIIIEQPRLLLEESAFSVAQKSSISPVEPKSDIEILAKVEQTANIKFDELKAVESSFINLEEPGNNIFKTPEIKGKYSHTSVEQPRLTIAEVFTILPDEPKDEKLEVFKITECKSTVDIEEIKAVETIIIHPEEPACEQLEVLRIEDKTAETTLEGPSLKVAETISILSEEPKDEFYVPQLKNQKAELTVIEYKVAEATILEAEESEQPELNIKQLKEKRSKPIIEPSKFSVAEVFATTFAESPKLIPATEKIRNQVAHIGIEKHKAIETTEVALGDLTYNKLTTVVPAIKQLESSVEESIQSVAQITEVHLADSENKISITSEVTNKAKATSAVEAIKTTEIIKSEKVDTIISPSSPPSPITPVVEEYVFSLDAELEHPYVVEEPVSEEALLRIKTQKNKIDSADTSFTLAIESVVEADSITVDEIEEVENIHLTKEIHETIYKDNTTKMSANVEESLKTNQVMSTEAHSFDTRHKLSVKNETVMQDEINVSSLERNQNISSAAINLDSSNKLSLQKVAVIQGDSMSSQASHISQSFLHKSRKNELSENSVALELESTVKTLQSGSSGASTNYESLQYADASNKQLSVSLSKSIESTVLKDNMDLETHQHLHKTSGSYKKAASEMVASKSLKTTGSESQRSTQVIKSESNASSLVDEKLTLRTDLKNTISDGDQISSPLSVPPTPLTDEYIFSLQAELPEESTFIPRDCSISPESTHEDVIVKGMLTSYKSKIEDRVLYSPPLPTPPTSPDKTKPVYNKPGLKGGSDREELTKEEIHDSTLVSAIDQTLKQIEEYKASVGLTTEEMSYNQEDVDKEFIPIHAVEEWLDNEAVQVEAINSQVEEVDAIKITITTEGTDTGETAVTVTTERNEEDSDIDLEIQEISNNYDEHDIVINEQINSEDEVDDFIPININSNKNIEDQEYFVPIIDPGRDEYEEDYEFVAVHPSSLNKNDDNPGSVTTNEFESEVSNKNEQMVHSLTADKSQELVMQHDQEILGEEPIIPPVESLKGSEVIKLLNEQRIERVEERKWTTFLQKKYTQTPKTQVVYYGDFDVKTQLLPDAYKVKIVKQPKPKIAPDWKAEELKKESSPVIEISETQETEGTEIQENNKIEQDTKLIEQDSDIIEEEIHKIDQEKDGVEQEDKLFNYKAETEIPEEDIDKESEELELDEMAQRNLAEELIKNVENMIDVNAPTEQQLEQMRDQLAALAQLPSVIQQTVELVNKRINLISQKEEQKKKEEEEQRRQEEQERAELEKEKQSLEMRVTKTEEELAIIKKEEVKRILEMRIREEKQRKEIMELTKIDQESRQVTQRSIPRMGKPTPLFGPLQERPVILPGGRKWRTPEDVYNEELISETLVGQAEVIKGTAIGVNFKKFEKPPPPLDHLKHSEVFKAIHDIEKPYKKVDYLGAVLSEADYRERARSMSPCVEKIAKPGDLKH